MSFFYACACAHAPALVRACLFRDGAQYGIYFLQACLLVLRLCPSSFSAPELLSFVQDWLTIAVSLALKPRVENGPYHLSR